MKKIVLACLLALGYLQAANYPYADTKSYNSWYKSSLNAAGLVNAIVSNLADQLSQNKDFLNNATPIAITSILNLEDFQETSKMGNIISENLIHEMQVRGFRIVDYKTMTSIKVEKSGDYIFSRIVEELQKDHSINYVLSGTYTIYKDGLAVNCRIIDMNTHVVVSSAQVYIPKQVVQSIDHKAVEKKYKKVEHLVIPSVEEKSLSIR